MATTSPVAADPAEDAAFTSIEEERLQRIGVAVLTALVLHFGLFFFLALSSWTVEVKPPPFEEIIVLKNEIPSEVNREPPPTVEPPEDAIPDIADLTAPDEDKSKTDAGGPVVDPNFEIADHYETDDAAAGHGAKGDPNADMSNLAAAIDNFGTSSSGIQAVHGSGAGHGTGERYGQRGPGGQRNLTLKYKGSRSTQEAVRMCLKWLAKHQSPDGRWDSDGFDAQCTHGRCGGKGSRDYDVGLTGLALVAFTGHGDTHKTDGEFKETVEKGIKFLLREQKSNGYIGDEKMEEGMYNHSLGAYALADAYVLTRDPILKEPIEKAVAYLLAAQNPGKAWRYQNYNAGRSPSMQEDGSPGSVNDTSVTGWVVMALHAAEEGGIAIPPAAYAGANAWLDEVMQEKTRDGQYGIVFGYDAKGKFVHNKPYVTTAAGALIRQFTGVMTGVDGAVTVLASHPPEYGQNKANFYEWYYSTLVLFQYGGEPWEKWNEALKKAVCQNLRHKETETCVLGSMDPVDYWGGQSGGRIYATACAALCMEIYYRYIRLGEKKK